MIDGLHAVIITLYIGMLDPFALVPPIVLIKFGWLLRIRCVLEILTFFPFIAAYVRPALTHSCCALVNRHRRDLILGRSLQILIQDASFNSIVCLPYISAFIATITHDTHVYSFFHRKVNNVPHYQRLYQDTHSHAPIWLKVCHAILLSRS